MDSAFLHVNRFWKGLSFISILFYFIFFFIIFRVLTRLLADGQSHQITVTHYRQVNKSFQTHEVVVLGQVVLCDGRVISGLESSLPNNKRAATMMVCHSDPDMSLHWWEEKALPQPC